MTNKNIAIIGCGRVGTALAVFLAKAGFHIAAVASKRVSSAENTVQAILNQTSEEQLKKIDINQKDKYVLEKPQICSSSVEAAIVSDIIFITTPDNIIETVCSDISSNDSLKMDEKTFFHCSGALSSCVLASAANKGANTGSIHPLQSFAIYDLGQKSPFIGINVSVEGNEMALSIGKELVQALGANHFTIPTKSKTLYHAAAVVASNYLVTIENCAIELLKEADLPEHKAYEILEPLIQGTLSNIKSRGTVAALTGPIARGDIQIVEKHLKDIEKILPDFSKLYRVMGQYTLKLAEKRGELNKFSIEAFSDILEGV